VFNPYEKITNDKKSPITKFQQLLLESDRNFVSSWQNSDQFCRNLAANVTGFQCPIPKS